VKAPAPGTPVRRAWVILPGILLPMRYAGSAIRQPCATSQIRYKARFPLSGRKLNGWPRPLEDTAGSRDPASGVSANSGIRAFPEGLSG
jgi:hypothetical protein